MTLPAELRETAESLWRAGDYSRAAAYHTHAIVLESIDAVSVLDRPRSRSMTQLDTPQAAGAGCDQRCLTVTDSTPSRAKP